MSFFQGIKCIRCSRVPDGHSIYEGCAHCAQEGINVNYTTVYDLQNATFTKKDHEKGIFKYRDFYPINDSSKCISLCEGNTPLLHAERLGTLLKIPNLYLKDESRNPTLSHKDRLMAVAVTRAVQEGYGVITVSSTGNHGAAAAAYAAAAGLDCVIFTQPQVPETMKTLMQVYGAKVVATPNADDRWVLMRECTNRFGWLPCSGFINPPIGSSCYAVDGYKSIAFELYEQLDFQVPDFVVVPTSYADAIYGIYKGMQDLKTMNCIPTLPRMVASEVNGSMLESLKQNSDSALKMPSFWSVSFSIEGPYTTYQGMEAVKASQGYARCSDDEETMAMQLLLAKEEGIYVEASSATGLVAAKKLADEGKIKPEDKVVVILTSTGLKGTKTTQKLMPDVPVIKPDINDLLSALKTNYNLIP